MCYYLGRTKQACDARERTLAVAPQNQEAEEGEWVDEGQKEFEALEQELRKLAA